MKTTESQRKANAKYHKKIKQRVIAFYPNEEDLYNFSKKINFQNAVKCFLRVNMIIEEENKENDVRKC